MRKFNNKTLLLAIAILLIANLLFLTAIILLPLKQSNNGGIKHFKGHKQPPFEHILINELDLNNVQIEQIKTDRLGFKEQKWTIREQMHNIRAEINKELIKDSPDSMIIDSLIKTFAAKHIEFDTHNIHSLLAIKKYLNNEQKIKFDSIVCNNSLQKRYFKNRDNN